MVASRGPAADLRHCLGGSARRRGAQRLGRTLQSWRREFLAYFATGGASNRPAEAVNLIIEKTWRLGRGFRNWDNYRLRLLLRCGGIRWSNLTTPRIRTRRPRSVA